MFRTNSLRCDNRVQPLIDVSLREFFMPLGAHEEMKIVDSPFQGGAGGCPCMSWTASLRQDTPGSPRAAAPLHGEFSREPLMPRFGDENMTSSCSSSCSSSSSVFFHSRVRGDDEDDFQEWLRTHRSANSYLTLNSSRLPQFRSSS